MRTLHFFPTHITRRRLKDTYIYIIYPITMTTCPDTRHTKNAWQYYCIQRARSCPCDCDDCVCPSLDIMMLHVLLHVDGLRRVIHPFPLLSLFPLSTQVVLNVYVISAAKNRLRNIWRLQKSKKLYIDR